MKERKNFKVKEKLFMKKKIIEKFFLRIKSFATFAIFIIKIRLEIKKKWKWKLRNLLRKEILLNSLETFIYIANCLIMIFQKKEKLLHLNPQIID